MSFQGDVAGLGLGELLQGLARGGREGVLTLRGGNLSARLGVLEGQLHLLPEEDEDPETWRKRCERAWVADPDQRIDTLRMREIAHASRLETMFRLLDCAGVHFRFEPGPLPDLTQPIQRNAPVGEGEPLARMETGTKLDVQTHVVSPPISVEFLLLEYARLCDELGAHPAAMELSDHFVARTLADSAPHKSFERLWAELDGVSNVAEVADRLGWPVRQVRAGLCDIAERGALRFADAREQIALAQRELQAGRLSRAASRLSGWCRLTVPGRVDDGDLQLLIGEWERGKLPVALASMECSDARTLLRRMDAGHPDPSAALARWTELRKHHRHDPICELRCLHWQHRSQVEAEFPSMSELLRVARKFHETGHPWRSGLVLRAAASRAPETTSVRMEIGQRLVAVGLVDEGAGWIVEACRALILAGAADRAVAPLRQLLQVSPGQREAKALLGLAHGKTVSGKRTRRNSVVALASALTISVLAVVKVRVDQAHDEKFDAVQEQIDDPVAALALLDEQFGDSSDSSVLALRRQLEERIETRSNLERADWIARFQSCQLECTGGDPVLGLQNALAMPPPPKGKAANGEELPKLSSLLEGLVARFEENVSSWEAPTVDSAPVAHAEQRMSRLIQELRSVAATAAESPDLLTFRGKLESLALTLSVRAEIRAKEREKRQRAETIERQDVLLAAARAHASAGDLARAVESYDQIVALPGSEKLVQILAQEIAGVRSHHDAWQHALALANEGKHVEALAQLAGVCPNPGEHLLPCRIESHPSGARVRFSDGSSRTTPFVLEVAPGERMTLSVEHEGCETTRVDLDQPANQMLYLSRAPSAAWASASRVEAIPVSVDDDHVVCDRSGRVARLSHDGGVLWTRSLDSLGGVARTPVFLTKRAGSLLVVTEEGTAWILDAADGRVEGPWPVGSPPMAGPEPTSTGVRVRFRDGHEIVWTSRLKPESEARLDPGEPIAPSRGHDAGLTVMRRGMNESQSLASPWSALQIEVRAGDFAVREDGRDEIAFTVRRQGEWNYVAWEAPKVHAPRGRLWISDGTGLRSFEP